MDFSAMTEEVVDALGVGAIYTHASGTTFPLTVIFDNSFRAFDLGNVGVESNSPEASCKSSDISSPARGDTIEIHDIVYTVRSVRPDAEGLTVLTLSEPT
jgi:hypothetical protein